MVSISWSFLCLVAAPFIASYYSSILTNASASFIRAGSLAAGSYYYEAIKINVYTPDNYSIRSSSSLDTFGYLYNNNFDPTYPFLNLLQSNDDGAGSSQFLLSRVLQTMVDYILVVTAYHPATTGAFSIIVQGPAAVSLTSINVTGNWRQHTSEYPILDDVSFTGSKSALLFPLSSIHLCNKCSTFFEKNTMNRSYSILRFLHSYHAAVPVFLHISVDQQQLDLLPEWYLFRIRVKLLSTDRIHDFGQRSVQHSIQQ